MSAEKKILHFLKDKSGIFSRVAKLDQGAAIHEIGLQEDFGECCTKYFETCMLPYLPEENNWDCFFLSVIYFYEKSNLEIFP